MLWYSIAPWTPHRHSLIAHPRQQAESARFNTLNEVKKAIDGALAEAEHRIASGKLTSEELIGFLRVELGREHPQGPHHDAPGLEYFEASLDRLVGLVPEG